MRLLCIYFYAASAIQLKNSSDSNISPVYFFLHRKAGEFLSSHFLELLEGQLGFDDNYKNVEWHAIQPGVLSHCQNSNLIFYQDINPQTLDKIMQDCPTFRAVHFRRDQVDTLVSNYVYTKNLTVKTDYIEKKHDHPGMQEPLDAIMLGTLLRSLPPLQGIKEVCLVDTTLMAPPAITTYRKVQTEQLQQVLQVRFEDFNEDFDATTTAIFEHVLYNEKDDEAQFREKQKLITNLVSKAKEYDISRTTDSMADDHISDADLKADARKLVDKLIEEKNPCIEEVLRQNIQLGYTNSFP